MKVNNKKYIYQLQIDHIVFAVTQPHETDEISHILQKTSPHLQDVALLDGGVLQLAGLLLQTLSCAADGQAGHDFLW